MFAMWNKTVASEKFLSLLSAKSLSEKMIFGLSKC